jgi:hypothetical protein
VTQDEQETSTAPAAGLRADGRVAVEMYCKSYTRPESALMSYRRDIFIFNEINGLGSPFLITATDLSHWKIFAQCSMRTFHDTQ